MDEPTPDLGKLTDQQLNLLTIIINYVAEHDKFPTIRELMPLMGLASTSGPRYHIDALVAAGAVIRMTSEHSRPSYRLAGTSRLWPKWVAEHMGWL